MKSSLAVVAVVMTVAIAGCENRAATPDGEPDAPAPATEATPPVPAAVAPPPSPATTPAPPVAPEFAAIYPNSEVEGEPLVAVSDQGPGGVVTFSTDAPPDTVIAFYRERAEAAGMAMVMTLNRGDARAYGALKQASGASLNVVASPIDNKTSVQLTWSAGT
jgi:hypothetical protein